MSKENIDHWLSHGVDLESRTLYLGKTGEGSSDEESGINSDIARRAIMGLQLLDKINAPIKIILAAGDGGDYSDGMTIFDNISHAQSYIIMETVTCCASISSIILQSADCRMMRKHGYMLIHNGSVQVEDSSMSAINWVSFEESNILPSIRQIYLSRLRERDHNSNFKVKVPGITILNKKLPEGARKISPKSKASAITESHVSQLLNQDIVFTAEECLALNLIDEII